VDLIINATLVCPPAWAREVTDTIPASVIRPGHTAVLRHDVCLWRDPVHAGPPSSGAARCMDGLGMLVDAGGGKPFCYGVAVRR